MKLLIVLLEGQLYLAAILAIFVAELGFLFWGLWSRRPVIGLVAVFAAVPLLRSTLSTIAACFVRIRPPDGLPLARSEGIALYELVAEIRRAIDAPTVDSIVITGGFDASAVAQSAPWRFGRRRTLVLGLPVLTTLSTAELRAVIAHELAHFSSGSDSFAAWVYRTRRRWFDLRTVLDRRLATPLYVYWLIRWYIPRLDKASTEVARHHELIADGVAAKVAGSRAAADALVIFESGARYADASHWPAIHASYETAGELPRPYSQMLSWSARVVSSELLADLFGNDTEPGDTHPSLRDRFAHLGETIRIPPSAERSAGEEILGGALAKLANQLDDDWDTRHGKSWRERRAAYVERRATVDRLSSIEIPTADELFMRGELVEDLDGSDEALPIYQSAAAQGHAAASLTAGRLLLDRMDRNGIALVEDAMSRDDSLVPEACRLLAAYYKRSNQNLAAQKCEWRAARHSTKVRLAQRSRKPGADRLTAP
ncbi:MAG TPA: M48 family metallopeptidase [Vicinamibacterales bacterium]|nr:M48 family metallopeptidase [Vicinamibacterales bacterium]